MLSVKGKKTNALNDLNEIEFVLNYLYLKRGFMFCVYYEVIKYGRRESNPINPEWLSLRNLFSEYYNVIKIHNTNKIFNLINSLSYFQ